MAEPHSKDSGLVSEHPGATQVGATLLESCFRALAKAGMGRASQGGGSGWDGGETR